MPTLTTTIEDTSPIIVYSKTDGSDNWRAGSSRNDPFVDSYSQSSFMVTNVSQASVAFTFYGTGVQLFGAKRQNHGYYQISIDSIVYPQVNGALNDTQGQFQTTLFSTVALANGYHTVRMTNLGAGDLDLDFITWQTPVGQVDEPIIATTIQDSDPSFKYSPASQWGISPANIGMFSGGSGHATSTAGAFVEFKFKGSCCGDAVALYGPVSTNGAPYSVSLDGADPLNYTAAKQSYRPQQILYQASNLGGKEHTVKIQSEAWTISGSSLAIDYAEVYTSGSLQHGGSGLSKGDIVGIAIGSIAGLAILLVLVFFGIKLRSRYNKYFRLQGKSERGSKLIAEPFDYHSRPTSYIGSSHAPSPHSPPTHLGPSREATLHSHPSHRSTPGGLQHYQQHSQGQTPPSSLLWPNSNGTGGIYTTISGEPAVLGPNTQVITIPFTPDGKYRPDLAQAPQLLSPPGSIRRQGQSSEGPLTDSVGEHTTGHRPALQPNRNPNQATLGSLPLGARYVVPTVSEEDRRIASEESARFSGEGGQYGQRLAPLRPQIQGGALAPPTSTSGRSAPPEYMT